MCWSLFYVGQACLKGITHESNSSVYSVDFDSEVWWWFFFFSILLNCIYKLSRWVTVFQFWADNHSKDRRKKN